MCNHLYGLYTRQYQMQSRALWRCGACGRQSSAPIDCCTQPNFVSRQRSSRVRTWVRWLGETGSHTLIGLCAMLQRRWQAAADNMVVTPDRRGLAHELLEEDTVAPADWDQRPDTFTYTDTETATDTETVVETTHVSV